MGNVMAPEVHENKLCSDFMFYYWNNCLRTAKSRVTDVKGCLRGEIEKESEVSEVEDHTRLYMKHQEVYSRDPRRRNFFSSSVSELGIYFWSKEET